MHFTMKLELSVRKDVSHVELVKGDQLSLGITVRDGSRDEAGPVIKKVKPRSLAERSYAVAEGDIILALNGRDVTGRGRKDVQRMVKESVPKIHLNLQYEIREASIFRSGLYCKKYATTKLRKVGSSFGFILRKKDYQHPFSMQYPVISNIKRGGPAYNDGLLQEGDSLLKVDDVSLSWLSVADISRMLQDKIEAKFTFEYNVRVVDFPESPGRRIDLEIEVPHDDLGISMSSYSTNSRAMCISSIRIGSVAERCGVFSKEDIVLSINDIDTEFLTVSKANALLRLSRQSRKISFISTKVKEPKSVMLLKNCLCSLKDKDAASEGSISAQETDKQHHNTPASTNSTLSMASKSCMTKEFYHREQVKAIRKFQDITKYMTQLKQILSQLTLNAFENKENIHNCQEKCTTCNRTQHSVKLCASCLSKMNAKCAQSMEFLRHIITHFINVSLKQENLSPPNPEPKAPNSEAPIRNNISKNLVHSLTEMLPKVFSNKTELAKSFQTLAEKIANADVSCSTCKDEIESASLTTQKLLLLISLNDRSAETQVLINQLVYCLLETKLSCDTDADSPDLSLDGDSVTESEHAGNLPQFSTTATNSEVTASRPHSGQQQIVEAEFHEVDLGNSPTDNNDVEYSADSSPKAPDLKVDLNQQSAYFKLIDVESLSGSEICSGNELSETIKIRGNRSRGTMHVDKNSSAVKANITEKSPTPNKSEEPTKKVYKDKGFFSAKANIWRSLDSFLNPKKYPLVQDGAHENAKAGGSQDLLEVPGCSYVNLPQSSSSMLYANYHPKGNKRKDSESNHGSNRSSVKEPTENHEEVVKTHKETMEVKMTSDGGDYGLVLGFSSPNFKDTLPVPIIKEVKPKSAAQKTGILAKNDRVLAINGSNIVGIPLADLENLKRQVFRSSPITLTIEFDVVDAEMQFGTFEVVLKKTLKVGLFFEEMKKGCPMVVSSMVKGSAAHRSGQLFPRDKLLHLKCMRNEEFDPFSCYHEKEEFVTITVQRDRHEGIKESPIRTVQSSTNPFSSNAGPSNAQSGVNFILKRTSIRPIEGSSTLVLDQELTLFRDPTSWDFGFLVGEDPVTGRAYVTDVKPGGPASASGVMMKFDRIVEVNGVMVSKNKNCSVLSLLTQANGKVDLLIRRIYHEKLNVTPQKPQKQKLPSFM